MVEIETLEFGTTQSGQAVQLYVIKDGDYSVAISNFGATVVEINCPDKNGQIENINLGYPNLNDYELDTQFFGCIAGRFANRIANGQFEIDGKGFEIPCNDFPSSSDTSENVTNANALHGGPKGFNKSVWEAKVIESDHLAQIKMKHVSEDGDQGFPGRVEVMVTFSFSEVDGLIMEYQAITDHSTPINLTNHCYFNLAGAGSGNVFKQDIQIFAEYFLPINEAMIPTGDYQLVADSPFDLIGFKNIGEQLLMNHQQLNLASGFDHNFVIDRKGMESQPRLVARAKDNKSGRLLEVITTEPGVQFYTGNFLDGVEGRDSKIYESHGGFCLETQHFPNSPNQENFPNTILKPGNQFKSTTIYKFSLAE